MIMFPAEGWMATMKSFDSGGLRSEDIRFEHFSPSGLQVGGIFFSST